MAVTFAAGLRACCVGAALLLGTIRAAETPPSLIGATRDQVLARHGEPKSQMAAGNRVILFYPSERIVLRDGVVVEVQPIATDTTRRAPSPAPAATPMASPSADSPSPANDAPATGAAANETSPPTPPPPAEPKLEIKLVRPPGSKAAQSPAAPAAPAPESSKTTTPTPATPAPAEVAPKSGANREEPASPAAVVATDAAPAVAAADGTNAGRVDDVADSDAKEKRAKATKAARRRLDEAVIADPTEDLFTGRSYLIAAIILVGGVSYLVWRSRQRQLELAATSVSSTPLAAAAGSVARDDAVFTASMLNQLERDKFEDLVAAYYAKTGVVAARTKSDPTSPVHIKISWKGEPRPFAFVQCIARPSGLVEVKPLQDLAAALAAEDIRRGHVVTTGKFSVGARDLAEEKQITLLPGDIFLEKLNALPAAARAEIMQAVR